MAALKPWHRHRQETPEQLPEQSGQYLTFCSASQQFGINILLVREILELQALTPLPRMPPHVCGVLNLRGRAVPVIDLAQCLGRNATCARRRNCIIILQLENEATNKDIGILVEEVRSVLEISPQQIEAAPQLGDILPAQFIAGMAHQEQGFIVLLQAEHLVSPDELTRLYLAQQHAQEPTGAEHE